MRGVYAAFPTDLDVCALFAEAMMNRTPWQLWDLTSGEPVAGADTLEAVAVLEQALRLMDEPGAAAHPGVLHMYIHTMEMSPHPERALRACDALRDLVPDAGHLRHMPSHIDVLCGHYYAGMVANSQAILADCTYVEQQGPLNFYTLYRSHNYHFKLYAAMFLGQYRPALQAASDLSAAIPPDLLRVTNPPMADWLEGFVGMKMHVLVRFGKWQEILDEPLPDDTALYCVTTAMVHYANADEYLMLAYHTSVAYWTVPMQTDKPRGWSANSVPTMNEAFLPELISALEREGKKSEAARLHELWNGKVERFHQTMAREWAYGLSYRSHRQRNQALPHWLHHYNHRRPHSAIEDQPPISRVHNVRGQDN